MKLYTYTRLSVMMFLQYAVLGSWSPVLAVYLEQQLHLSGAQTGAIFSLPWLGCMISPFIAGQIADRWVPTQWLLAVLHLAAGTCLWIAAKQTGFGQLWIWMLLFALFFAPTLALSNSVSFKHLTNTAKQFGAVRVFGTFGWIAAGLALTGWRTGALGIKPWPSQADALMLAAMADWALGAWCLLLPHTPPSRSGESPWAVLKVLRMAKDRRFLTFLVVTFIIATQLHFYYMLGSAYLNDMGIKAADLPSTMTLAQSMEILFMVVGLPLLLPRLGFRTILLIGAAAWPVRYAIWALVSWLSWPVWVAVAALTLHGFCSVFFFVASQLYVDTVAPKDVRHSAQALLTLVTMGLGYYIGTHFAGLVQDFFTHPKLSALGQAVVSATGTPEHVTNWALVMLVPIVVTGLCTVAYFLFLREVKPGELDAAVGTEVDEVGAEPPEPI